MGEGMETSAAIYVRRSAMDDREGDNRSLGAQERECREWAAIGLQYSRMRLEKLLGPKSMTFGFSQIMLMCALVIPKRPSHSYW